MCRVDEYVGDLDVRWPGARVHDVVRDVVRVQGHEALVEGVLAVGVAAETNQGELCPNSALKSVTGKGSVAKQSSGEGNRRDGDAYR